MSKNVKEMIDRMVEESIRRILPSVMNEVLIRTISESLAPPSTVQHSKPKKSKARNEQPKRSRMQELLEGHDSIGADFYEPSARHDYDHDDENEIDHEQTRLSTLQSLPPMLREMASDMSFDDEEDHSFEQLPDGKVVQQLDIEHTMRSGLFDPSAIARRMGPSKQPKMTAENQQFEELRLKRMRESLERPA